MIAVLMAIVHVEYVAVGIMIAVAFVLCCAWPLAALSAWDSKRRRRKAAHLAGKVFHD